MQALFRPGQIHSAHLKTLLVPLVKQHIPYHYFVDIGSGQKICSRRYQFVHQDVVCDYLPVVFEVDGCMSYSQATRGDALQLHDKERGSPVTAKGFFVVGPSSDDDRNWV